MLTQKQLLFRIRGFIVFFMVALGLSGITAFPAETELHWVLQHSWLIPSTLLPFVTNAYNGLAQTNKAYPMLAYGYDWLAFAHLVIAMMFIGPLQNPVRNKWVITWAMLACIAILPLAFIAGPIRGIPLM